MVQGKRAGQRGTGGGIGLPVGLVESLARKEREAQGPVPGGQKTVGWQPWGHNLFVLAVGKAKPPPKNLPQKGAGDRGVMRTKDKFAVATRSFEG